MKTAHLLTDKRHASRFGSTARHISDLSDVDRNQFVLLGGQDGWLGSTTFADQLPLWRRGDYVSVPLMPETAAAAFPHRTDLRP
jgi:penicillin amidase